MASEFQIHGEALDRDPALAPELVSLGSDRYEATYDAALDAITAWLAIVDGETAQRILLTCLTETFLQSAS